VAQHPDELDLVEDETVITVVPLANAAEKDDTWTTVRTTWQTGVGASIIPGPRRKWGRPIPDDILALSELPPTIGFLLCFFGLVWISCLLHAFWSFLSQRCYESYN
jgi:hypothetical protein